LFLGWGAVIQDHPSPGVLPYTQKPALIFPVYLDDHCQAQELSQYLLKWKKSSTEEAHTL
jgi:hypothetical protein